MASSTRSRVSGRTIAGVFSTFETVCRETPAASATSLTVGCAPMLFLPGFRDVLRAAGDVAQTLPLRVRAGPLPRLTRSEDRDYGDSVPV